MKVFFIIGGAVAAWLLYEHTQSSETSDSLPVPVAPIVTGSDCTSRHDAQGNWYGVDFSGNCTIQSLGGAEGDF